MTSQQDHVEGVSRLIADYRQGDISPGDPEHVSRWLHQFDASVRGPFIAELHHVLNNTYLSRATFDGFYKNQIEHDKLTGGDHATFWRGANFLRIQSHGNSQADVLKIFRRALKEVLGLKLSECGGGSHFIYLDDVIFSGSRVGSDLENWVANDAPDSAVVIVIVMATHEFGEYATKKRLREAAAKANKRITFQIWRSLHLENRRLYRNDSDVLWPTALPPEAAAYAQGRFPFEPRSPGGKSSLFSSEAARQVLESAFLSAGMRIRSFSQTPAPSLRPLGFGPFGVGFGSLFVTYRNCPNNAPLALWWGDPEADPSHPFSKWRPLVPRKTYGPFDNVEL